MQIPLGSLSTAASVAATTSTVRNAQASVSSSNSSSTVQQTAKAENTQDRDADERYDDMHRQAKKESDDSNTPSLPEPSTPGPLLQLDVSGGDEPTQLDLRG